jgi:EpsI family protein
VVDACSGIRYLVASFMVGSLYAYLNYRTVNRRLIFVALSILVPIVANWLRAYLTVMLGHLSANKLATGFDHLIYGWLFFGVVIMALFAIGARWTQVPAAPVLANAGVAADLRVPRAVWPVGLMAVALLCSPQLLLVLAAQQASIAPRLQLQERLTADWRAIDQPVTDWTPSIQPASAQAQRSYRSNDMEVGVYIAYYRNQDTSHQLISSSNALVKDQDQHWNLLSRGVASVPATAGGFEADSAEIVSASMSARSRNAGLMVWHWYWVGGVVTRSEVAANLLGVWQRLTGQGDESAAIVLYAQQDESDSGRIALQSFARDNWSLLDQQLRETSHRK